MSAYRLVIYIIDCNSLSADGVEHSMDPVQHRHRPVILAVATRTDSREEKPRACLKPDKGWYRRVILTAYSIIALMFTKLGLYTPCIDFHHIFGEICRILALMFAKLGL